MERRNSYLKIRYKPDKVIPQKLRDDKEWLKNLQNDERGKKAKRWMRKRKDKKYIMIKDTLWNFTIVHQNIRGLKSKGDSVQELIDDYQPKMLCIVESHMQEEEEQYPGMRPYIGMILPQKYFLRAKKHNMLTNSWTFQVLCKILKSFTFWGF